MNLAELSSVAADEANAFEYIERLRWPNGPVCPHCGATDRISHLEGVRTKPSKKHPQGEVRHGLWKCYHCRKQFTVRVGSIFEDSPIPLGKWILAIHLMCSSKKGISSNQLKRELGISYQTAWFLTHRIRMAMTVDPLKTVLGGENKIVEIDETYVGGKEGNNLHRNNTKAAGKKVAVNTISARAVPKDVEERKVAILLADQHVAGKISWKAHEKAGMIFRMSRELNMNQGDIATYLRQSKTTVGRFLDAYSFMKDKFLAVDNGKYAADGEEKCCFFDEFFRSKDLREELKRDPDFGDDFCRWVGDGRLSEGIQMRDLPNIRKNPEARKKFEKVSKDTAFPETMKPVEAADPEQGSDFFKLLGKVREACTSAAQVKEILRIRTDKVARAHLLETYEALVDFMRLADVDPAEESRRDAA